MFEVMTAHDRKSTSRNCIFNLVSKVIKKGKEKQTSNNNTRSSIKMMQEKN